jgi:hypothetical protein
MQDQVVEYDVTEAAIARMREAYMMLEIKGLDDQAGIEAVHTARLKVKGKRVQVEKKRKELKKDALAWGRKVDSEAKRIFALLEPIETHLIEEENAVKEELQRIQDEKERKEKEAIQIRIDTLLGWGVTIPFFEVAAMTDPEYADALYKAEKDWTIEQARRAKDKAEREAEEERLEKVRLEQAAEADRLRVEKEKIDAERALIEKEKKAEADRIQAEKDAKDKAEMDRLDRIAAEEADKAEARRQESLKPDRDKLLGFADRITALTAGNLSVVDSESRILFDTDRR